MQFLYFLNKIIIQMKGSQVTVFLNIAKSLLPLLQEKIKNITGVSLQLCNGTIDRKPARHF